MWCLYLYKNLPFISLYYMIINLFKLCYGRKYEVHIHRLCNVIRVCFVGIEMILDWSRLLPQKYVIYMA